MAKTLVLRDYQEKGVQQTRDVIRALFAPTIMMAPCGAGKAVIAAYLLQESHRKFKHACIVVDRTSLVDQLSATLDEYGVPHGVIQAGHPRRAPWERIQVCSAQTLEARGSFPKCDLLIIDEAHAIRSFITAFIKSQPKLTVIGLTATPFTKGLSEIYGNLVNICTTNFLIEKKRLVPLKIYSAKEIDMDGAATADGEWTAKAVEERGLRIIGDIVSEYVAKVTEHFGRRVVKTIGFVPTVEFGKELCAQFQAIGLNFQQISYQDGNDDERRAKIEEFRRPDSVIDGLISCEALTKGLDVPDILCGIGARPYRKSLSSHIQQIGRVMRTAPGKEFGLWLDHCQNVLRFKEDTDRIFEHGLSKLDDGKLDSRVRPEPKEKEKQEWSCTCGYIFPYKMDVCPSCGKERVTRSMIEVVPGVMQAVDHDGNGAAKTDGVKDFLIDRESVWRQICNEATFRKKGDGEAARKWALAQYKNIYGVFPSSVYSAGYTDQMDKPLRNLIQSRLIAHAHRQKKAAGKVSAKGGRNVR